MIESVTVSEGTYSSFDAGVSPLSATAAPYTGLASIASSATNTDLTDLLAANSYTLTVYVNLTCSGGDLTQSASDLSNSATATVCTG